MNDLKLLFTFVFILIYSSCSKCVFNGKDCVKFNTDYETCIQALNVNKDEKCCTILIDSCASTDKCQAVSSTINENVDCAIDWQ